MTTKMQMLQGAADAAKDIYGDVFRHLKGKWDTAPSTAKQAWGQPLGLRTRRAVRPKAH